MTIGYGMAIFFVPCFLVGYLIFSQWLGEKTLGDFVGNCLGATFVGFILYFVGLAAMGYLYGLA